MRPTELARVVVIGAVLIAAGLVPGFFQRLEEGMQSFFESLRSPTSPFEMIGNTNHEDLPRPTWLALLGVAVILLGLLSYITNSGLAQQ